MFGSDSNAELGARLSGKLKTIFQMVGLVLALFGIAFNQNFCTFGLFVQKASSMGVVELLANVGMTVSIAAALLFTLWSFVDYIVYYKKYINNEESK